MREAAPAANSSGRTAGLQADGNDYRSVSERYLAIDAWPDLTGLDAPVVPTEKQRQLRVMCTVERVEDALHAVTPSRRTA